MMIVTPMRGPLNIRNDSAGGAPRTLWTHYYNLMICTSVWAVIMMAMATHVIVKTDMPWQQTLSWQM